MSGDEGGRTAVRVRIAGEEYTVRSEADEAYTRRCAALVDERMRRFDRDPAAAAQKRVAILAALSIASDFLQHQARVEEEARTQAKRLEEVLEEASEE